MDQRMSDSNLKALSFATADDSERDNVQMAIDVCPMQAIFFAE